MERIGIAGKQRENSKTGTKGVLDKNNSLQHLLLGFGTSECRTTTRNSGSDQEDSANVFNGFKKRAVIDTGDINIHAAVAPPSLRVCVCV